ncbi:hypothetical protein THAOC_17505, partial [Thalassiosira oceanica]
FRSPERAARSGAAVPRPLGLAPASVVSVSNSTVKPAAVLSGVGASPRGTALQKFERGDDGATTGRRRGEVGGRTAARRRVQLRGAEGALAGKEAADRKSPDLDPDRPEVRPSHTLGYGIVQLCPRLPSFKRGHDPGRASGPRLEGKAVGGGEMNARTDATIRQTGGGYRIPPHF